MDGSQESSEKSKPASKHDRELNFLDISNAQKIRNEFSENTEQAKHNRYSDLDVPPLSQEFPNYGPRSDQKKPIELTPEEKKAIEAARQKELETVDAISKELTRFGKDPDAQLTRLMKDNQVVGLGDGHGGDEPLEKHAEEYLKALKDGGATHLVIETSPTTAKMIEEFNKTGKLDESQLPILSQNSNYVAMLMAAHKLGLTIVPGDSQHSNSDQPDRNPTMANTIEGILNAPNQNPDHPNKVVFWVGSMHLRDYHRSEGSNNLSAAEILRKDHIKLATVSHEEGSSNGPIGEAAAKLNHSEIVSTRDTKTLDTISPGGFSDNEFDYVIMFPKEDRN